jgi:hypothetical protein
MKATILLADSAQVAAGKLYVLGGGWSLTGPAPTPAAIALLIQVPWDEGNRVHTFKLELVDGDNRPVMVPTQVGDRPVELSAEFEAGRPPGIKPGSPLNVPLAMNLGPLPLPAGGIYVWRLTIDGHTEPNWEVTFQTRPQQQPTP